MGSLQDIPPEALFRRCCFSIPGMEQCLRNFGCHPMVGKMGNVLLNPNEFQNALLKSNTFLKAIKPHPKFPSPGLMPFCIRRIGIRLIWAKF